VKGPVAYREDIGTNALIQKRIDHMKKIREG
jgi:phosphoribosylamine--glycine ligase